MGEGTYGKPCWAVLDVQGISATTRYVLVDLSDSTNFSHISTAVIHLLSLDLSAEKAGDGVYDVWVGLISEVDALNGSADWFKVWHLEAIGNPTDSTDRFADRIDYTVFGTDRQGLTLSLSGETPVHFTTNTTEDGDTGWQTDTGLASPAGAASGATGKPGAGDLVVKVEEVSGSGTIDINLVAHYWTG